MGMCFFVSNWFFGVDHSTGRETCYGSTGFLFSLSHIARTFNFKEGVLTPKYLQLAKKFVYAPGEGVSKEAMRHEYFECHAVATADEDELNPRRAFAKLRWEGSLYRFSGVWYVYVSEHHLPHPYPNMIPKTTF